MTDKRYQVFVSSTYEDLKVERQEVMQALLALNCIPSGMELFPASDETQWDLIQRIIDDCDYYILIVAGRYGSIGPHGLSYSEMEYDYAIKTGKPTLAFVHSEPTKIESGRCERTDEGKQKLDEFRKKLRSKLYKGWSHPKDLKGEVAVSIGNLIKSKPATGWVRASEVLSSESASEINKLRSQVDELKQKLNAARITAPPGTSGLAQGEDQVMLGYTYRSKQSRTNIVANLQTSWNKIFEVCGPDMLQEASEESLFKTVKKWLFELAVKQNSDLDPAFYNFELQAEAFNLVKVQLIALGLIQKSEKPRSVKNAGTYWSLSSYGEQVLMNLLAVRRLDE